MRQVFIAQNLLEAQSIKNRLDDDGIESVIQGEHLSAAWGAVPIDPSTSPTIYVVRDEDFEKAIVMIEALKEAPPDQSRSPWRCRRCGELIDAQFTECWKCAAQTDTQDSSNSPEPEVAAEDDDISTGSDQLEKAPQVSPEQVPDRSDRELWIETSLVVFVFVLSSLYGAIARLIWPESYRAASAIDYSLAFLVRDAGAIAVVLYLVWRSGESWARFGLIRLQWLTDTLLGLACWATEWAVLGATWLIFYGWFGPDLFESPVDDKSVPTPVGLGAILVFVICVCVAAFTEELVMRAYLIPRFERLLGSSTWSVVVAAALFASYHAYQGIDGVISAFNMGVVFGAIFVWCRRVWPIAVAHAVGNLLVYWSIFAERV